MQHTLFHLEHNRTAVQADRQATYRVTHPPPTPGPTRRRAAAVLARVAWRLDRESALRAWP